MARRGAGNTIRTRKRHPLITSGAKPNLLPPEARIVTEAPVARQELSWFSDRFEAIAANIERVIQGKRSVVDLVVLGLLSEGHLLIEDVPGVGKTLLAKSLARSIHCGFQRVQFTPDLLPSDVTGVSVWDRERNAFVFRPGPVFSNIVLGDEINRASPKTQAALLEAMEERQVTVDGVTRHLTPPFMVVATQNPIEHEGTYPLPEAQLDRFMMRLVMGYPSREKELEILTTHGVRSTYDDLEPVISTEDVTRMVDVARRVYVSDPVRAYLVDTVEATRRDPDLLLGASPRATLFLQRGARTRAALDGRHYATPDDVKAMLRPVLTHRMILRPEAQMRGTSTEEIVDAIGQGVPVPGSRARA
jgi:MoxR-like ATPase